MFVNMCVCDGVEFGKEKTKLSLLIADMAVNIENTKEYIDISKGSRAL